MRICDKPRFGLRNTTVGQILLCPLINRVMHRPQQWIRHVTRVPAQGRAIRLDKRSSLSKGRGCLLLGCLQHQSCGCRLADPRRPIEQQMLRIRAAELGHQRFNGPLLTDNLTKILWTQQFHDRLG